MNVEPCCEGGTCSNLHLITNIPSLIHTLILSIFCCHYISNYLYRYIKNKYGSNSFNCEMSNRTRCISSYSKIS